MVDGSELKPEDQTVHDESSEAPRHDLQTLQLVFNINKTQNNVVKMLLQHRDEAKTQVVKKQTICVTVETRSQGTLKMLKLRPPPQHANCKTFQPLGCLHENTDMTGGVASSEPEW